MADSFYCSMGFGLDESSTSTCRDGEWVPKDPICLKLCFIPGYLNLTYLSISPPKREFIEGEIIMYYCKGGYRLDGEPHARCTEEGFDPPEVPRCEEFWTLSTSYRGGSPSYPCNCILSANTQIRISDQCNLCMEKNVEILWTNNDNLLNKRAKLLSRCRHRNENANNGQWSSPIQTSLKLSDDCRVSTKLGVTAFKRLF